MLVAKALPINSQIVINTHTSDKYDRYLTDIFYLPQSVNVNQIAKEGTYLNQELLDKGFAVVW